MIMPLISFCTLRYDEKTDRVYSENAPKNVDQNEYNNLLLEVMNNYKPRGFVQLTTTEYAAIFSWLRIRGTPTALWLIHDLEELIKAIKREVERIGNL